MTTTRSGGPSRASSGWASRRSTIIRAPTVSTPGESRSCGSVSHDGNIADRVAEHAAQFGGQVVGFAPGRGDDQQRPLPGQRAGDEQPRAGRADQRQFVGSIGGTRDESLQRRVAQRQLDEPRDRGLDRAAAPVRS